MVGFEIPCSGASSGWVICALEVNGIQTDQDQLVIGRFRFGGGRAGEVKLALLLLRELEHGALAAAL